MKLQELGQFLKKANRHTYAGDGEKLSPSRLSSEDLEYVEGDLVYHDTYFGNEMFIGEEIVYEKEVPVWGMNYYGKIIDDSSDAEEIYGFLKKALLQEHDNLIPVRGPSVFVEDRWEYQNNPIGNLDDFSGEETILKDGKAVYMAKYHGGIIKGKE